MIKFLISLVLCFSSVSCSLSDKELKNGWWKYGSGQHIGDVLNFKYLTIVNDTIFRENKKIGLIVSRKESLFGLTSNKLYIKPLINSVNYTKEVFNQLKANFPDSHQDYINQNSDELGIYHQK